MSICLESHKMSLEAMADCLLTVESSMDDGQISMQDLQRPVELIKRKIEQLGVNGGQSRDEGN